MKLREDTPISQSWPDRKPDMSERRRAFDPRPAATEWLEKFLTATTPFLRNMDHELPNGLLRLAFFVLYFKWVILPSQNLQLCNYAPENQPQHCVNTAGIATG